MQLEIRSHLSSCQSQFVPCKLRKFTAALSDMHGVKCPQTTSTGTPLPDLIPTSSTVNIS